MRAGVVNHPSEWPYSGYNEIQKTKKKECDVAMYMLRTIRVGKLTKIGKEFNLSNYSSVSTAVERIKRKMNKRVFRKRYKKILSLL